jgi:sugar phosphate isomerase/epimerase
MTAKPVCLTILLYISLFVTGYSQEIGLQLYSLRNTFATDAEAAMAKVKEMGFRNVELAGTYGLPFHEFIKLLAKNQLRVISFGVDFDKLEKFPQAVADEARAYGAQFVVCFWIPHTNTFTKEDADKAAAVFNAAGKVMAQYGMMLCYHPHGYEFQPYNNATLLDYMMDTFDSRYVNFEMDVFWIRQSGQDPVALLKKYSNRFILMHLKDRKHGTPSSQHGHADVESNVVLGTGDVGIADVMKAARDLGIKYYFIEDESSRAEQQIPKSLEFLKNLNVN